MKCVLLGLAILLAGCTGGEPTGPNLDFDGNSGPVTVNTTTGSNSPIGTAPCAVGGAPQKGTAQQAPTQDCSTATAEPFVVAPE